MSKGGRLAQGRANAWWEGGGIGVFMGEGSREIPEGWGGKGAGSPHPIHPPTPTRMAPWTRSHSNVS